MIVKKIGGKYAIIFGDEHEFSTWNTIMNQTKYLVNIPMELRRDILYMQIAIEDDAFEEADGSYRYIVNNENELCALLTIFMYLSTIGCDSMEDAVIDDFMSCDKNEELNYKEKLEPYDFEQLLSMKHTITEN